MYQQQKFHQAHDNFYITFTILITEIQLTKNEYSKQFTTATHRSNNSTIVLN